MSDDRPARSLTPGVHRLELEQVVIRFGWNEHRRQLIERLREALGLLRAAGCKRIYSNGSFVTEKQFPRDIDVCYDLDGIDVDAIDPVFLDFEDERAAQKARFGCEFSPAGMVELGTGQTFLEFFMHDRDGYPRGIVEVELTDDG